MLINGGILHGQGGTGGGDAVYFDGLDRVRRNSPLTATNTNHFSVSFFMRTSQTSRFIFDIRRANPVVRSIGLFQSGEGLSIQSNTIPAGSRKLWANTGEIGLTNNLWHHVGLTISGGGAGHTVLLYVDDLPVSMTKTDDAQLTSNFSYDYVGSESALGGLTTGGGADYIGDMADFYMSNQPIPFNITAVRRTFLTADGRAARRNDDGSDDETGIVPLIWMRGGKNTFPINAGSGGGYVAEKTFARSENTPIIIGT